MKLIVNPHKIQLAQSEAVNEKEINVSKCEFEFDNEITDDFVKEAYFTLGNDTYKKIIVNNECTIPQEVLVKEGTIELGVVATYTDITSQEITRYNPTPVYFKTDLGSLKEAQNSEEITPSEMEQYEQALNDGLETLNNAVDDLQDKVDSGYFKGEKGEKGDKGDKGDIGEKGQDGINGTNGKDGAIQYTAGDNITIDENNVISAEVPDVDLSNYYTKSEVNEKTIFEGNVEDYTTTNKLDLNKLSIGVHSFYISFSGGSWTAPIIHAKYTINGTTKDFDFYAPSPSSDKVLDGFVYIYKENDIPETVTQSQTFGKFYYSYMTSDGGIGKSSTMISMSTSGLSVYTDTSQNVSISMVTRTTPQAITGEKTFNTLPKSSLVPSNDQHLVNKKYVDDAVASAGGDSKSFIYNFDIQRNSYYLNDNTVTLNADELSRLKDVLNQMISDGGEYTQCGTLCIYNTSVKTTPRIYYLQQIPTSNLTSKLSAGGGLLVFDGYFNEKGEHNTHSDYYNNFSRMMLYVWFDTNSDHTAIETISSATINWNSGYMLVTRNGFDSSKTQVLKNINGTLTWVDE